MVIDFLSNHPSYIKEVASMIYKEFVENTSSEMTFEETLIFFSQTKKDGFPLTLIALEGEECLGTVSIVENDLKTQDVYKPWLASLYIKPQYRSRGVGQSLIIEVLKVAKNLGYQELYLKTETASDYYQSRGWNLVRKGLDNNDKKVDIFKMIL
ncbi:GNAT family N-acetyltransferase [Priestia aryabhattai]|uniref:GNAT family N-acetyltransferase n=1 Tax=Priestia aryabhattai TaxID=412384 RepID=UPI003C81D102